MLGNREYKSDVFSMLMAEKEHALEVYNALNGSDYDDPELVQVVTMEKGVSLSVRNDAAFVVESDLSLYEHQSSVCPNMPIRFLFYVVNILRRLLADKNLYGRTLIRIPLPKFVVFYNGLEDVPRQQEMKLSDAFEKKTDVPQLELACTVYNINSGKNDALLEKCGVLKGYTTFVNYVRFYQTSGGMEIKEAVSAAVDRCIGENILKDFFKRNREEVIKVTEMDFTFERQIELERIACRQEGASLSRIEMIAKKMTKGYDAQQTADLLELEPDYVKAVYAAADRCAPDHSPEAILAQMHL